MRVRITAVRLASAVASVFACVCAWAGPASGAGTLTNSFSADGFATFGAGTALVGGGSVVQADGSLLVEGQQTDADGANWITVTRFRSNGQPDKCFGDSRCRGTGTIKVARGLTHSGAAIALQADGKILAAGAVRGTNWKFGLSVTRLNANGTKDISFGSSGTAVITACDQGSASAVTQAKDGSVVLAGTVRCNGTDRMAVAKLDSRGRPVAGFGTGGLSMVPGGTTGWGVASQADGRTVVSGHWDDASGHHHCLVARLAANGALDPSFGEAGFVKPAQSTCAYAYNVAMRPDGRILASGSGFTRQVVVEAVSLMPDGSMDPSFGGGDGDATINDGNAGSQTMAVQPDGTAVFGSVHGTVVRMSPDGSPDAGFGTAGVVTFAVPGASDSAVNGVATSSDGRRVYASGVSRMDGRHVLLAASLAG